jgi:hypothetical protein
MDQKTVGRKLALLQARGWYRGCRAASDPPRMRFGWRIFGVRRAPAGSPESGADRPVQYREYADFGKPVREPRRRYVDPGCSGPTPGRYACAPGFDRVPGISAINGVRIPETEAESIARTLMQWFPDPDALLSAVSSVKPEEMARVDAARRPTGLLVTILEALAREFPAPEPDESNSDPDEYLDFPEEM